MTTPAQHPATASREPTPGNCMICGQHKDQTIACGCGCANRVCLPCDESHPRASAEVMAEATALIATVTPAPAGTEPACQGPDCDRICLDTGGDRPIRHPELPDGIDHDTSDLPTVARASRRVRAYITEWGDGIIDVANRRPLYARDVEALRRAAVAASAPAGDTPPADTWQPATQRVSEMDGWDYDDQARAAVDAALPHLRTALAAETQEVATELAQERTLHQQTIAERDDAIDDALKLKRDRDDAVRRGADRIQEIDRLTRLLSQTASALNVALYHVDQNITLAPSSDRYKARAVELAGCRIALEQATAASASVPPTRMQEPDDLVELVATATERHHLNLSRTDADGHNPCVCGGWQDGPDGPSWDEHLAGVALDALRAAGRLAAPTGPASSQVAASCSQVRGNPGAPTGPVADTTRAARTVSHGPAHPDSYLGAQGYVAACLCGETFIGQTYGHATNLRGEHFVRTRPVSAEPTPAPAAETTREA